MRICLATLYFLLLIQIFVVPLHHNHEQQPCLPLNYPTYVN